MKAAKNSCRKQATVKQLMPSTMPSWGLNKPITNKALPMPMINWETSAGNARSLKKPYATIRALKKSANTSKTLPAF